MRGPARGFPCVQAGQCADQRGDGAVVQPPHHRGDAGRRSQERGRRGRGDGAHRRPPAEQDALAGPRGPSRRPDPAPGVAVEVVGIRPGGGLSGIATAALLPSSPTPAWGALAESLMRRVHPRRNGVAPAEAVGPQVVRTNPPARERGLPSARGRCGS